jgi:hypothetical protein
MEDKNNFISKEKIDLVRGRKFDQCCVAYQQQIWFCKGKENGCFYESDVYGSDPYTQDSGICKTSLHKGLIDLQGGYVKHIKKGRETSFKGSTMNGITSLDWNEGFDSATLEKCDIPFERFKDASCGYVDILYCKGLNNSCKYMSFKQKEHVYGSNPYTYDSNNCKAALHSDYVGLSGGFYIKYPVGQVRSFRASTNNNVKSLNWVEYYEGFKLTYISPEVQEYLTKFHTPSSCSSLFSNRILYCKGKNNGCDDDYGVWGSNPYTFDSSACRSALHSGVIDSQGGIYLVKAVEIYDAFHISNSNSGVESQNWLVPYEGFKIEKI